MDSNNKVEQDYFEGVLRERLPEFSEILEEHIRDNDEVIPHLLTYNLLLFTQDALERGNLSLVRKITDLIEDLILKDDFMNNMINVSFLENLDYDQDYYEELTKYFGPQTLKEANDMKQALGYK